MVETDACRAVADSDPDLHYLMEGDYTETEALKTSVTLSQFLATGRLAHK